jgi:hypothetical protein
MSVNYKYVMCYPTTHTMDRGLDIRNSIDSSDDALLCVGNAAVFDI